MVKDKGKEIIKEKGDLVLKVKSKTSMRRLGLIDSYKPPIPFVQRLAKAKLETKFRKFLKVLKKLQSTSHSWMSSLRCLLMPSF